MTETRFTPESCDNRMLTATVKAKNATTVRGRIRSRRTGSVGADGKAATTASRRSCSTSAVLLDGSPVGPAERDGLQKRQRLTESLGGELLKRTTHGAVGANDQGSGDQQLRIVDPKGQLVGGDLAVLQTQQPDVALRIERDVPGVQLFVGDPGAVQRANLLPEIGQGGVIEVAWARGLRRYAALVCPRTRGQPRPT